MTDLESLPNMTGRKLFHNRVVLEEQIGFGGYGAVFKAKDVCDGKTLAVKCIPYEDMQDYQRILLMQECHVHAALSGHHEGILRQHSYDIDHEKRVAYIAFDYCDSGELFDLINANRYFEKPELVKNHILQVLDAVEFMHSKGCYHRDIKPENVLFKKDGKLVLADFGFATEKRTAPARTSRLGTVGYMAHELLNVVSWTDNEVDHEKTDIWALGITLFSMITGDVPWEIASEEQDDNYWRFRQQPQTYLSTKFDISPAANFLFVRIFNKSATQRPDIAAIKSCIQSIKNFGSGKRKREDGTLEPYPEPYFRPGFEPKDDIMNKHDLEPQCSKKGSENSSDRDGKLQSPKALSIIPTGDEDDCKSTLIPYTIPMPQRTPANLVSRRRQDALSKTPALSELSETSSAESDGPETPQTLAADAAQADKAASIPKLVLDIPAVKYTPHVKAKQALKVLKARIHMPKSAAVAIQTKN